MIPFHHNMVADLAGYVLTKNVRVYRFSESIVVQRHCQKEDIGKFYCGNHYIMLYTSHDMKYD